MLSFDDFVTECTGDNIFMIKTGRLFTPPTDVGVLEGITRDVVIGLAKRLGVPFEEKMLKMPDFYSADEVFLTGTAAEIIPVTKIDKRRIGKGEPGEITARLMDEFRRLTKTDGVRYDL